MFNFLKNKETLLQLIITKLLAKERIISRAKIKSVAILTSNELAQKNNIQELVKQSLEITNSEIFSFKKFDKNEEPSLINFTEKSINRRGEFVEEHFKKFIETPFDLLICFFDENNLYLEYASVLSKATYKVGFSEVNSELLDLEIKSDTSKVGEFLSELNKYLTILNKLNSTKNTTSKVNL